MNDHLLHYAQKIGVDKAIAYSSGSRIVQGITGVLSVFFITTFLTDVEQGFYYTFGSLLAMQVFFELGLTGIMTQFVAHEASHLVFNKNGNIDGDEQNISRLASLVRFCVKWYLSLAIIVFFFLLIIGFSFFSHYGDNKTSEVSWKIPWIIISISTSINIFQSPFISILSGLGKVKEMSRIGFYQQISVPFNWLLLSLGFKLYSSGIFGLISIFIWQFYIWKLGYAKLIMKLWSRKVTESISYTKELFPFQWRIALSWISGFFIFQLFNPVLFATEGAVVAGQMGMTLQALNSIQSFSFSWLNTKVPLYSKLIALKDYVTLDTIFNKTLKQMTFVCLVLLVAFFLLVLFLNISELKFGDHIIAKRFLGYTPLLLLMIPVLLQQYVNSWATYLRCHKKEPFLVNSILCGISCCVSTFVLGKNFGLYGVTIGYCIVTLLFFPWSYSIFKTKKLEWH